jgi:hypothetical protein
MHFFFSPVGPWPWKPPSFKGGAGGFYACFYNHAHHLRLEKLLYLEFSRSSNGFLKPLLDPGGGFTSKTAAWRFQKLNGRYEIVSEVKRLQIYNGNI